ncbi:EsaB/YukD family protein [Nocardioides ochotonae]|uniref:EsaB/YukD family protein n=1 Tax=Nocardioides ochotonae TaxID=2685869 RepID=UPI0031334698
MADPAHLPGDPGVITGAAGQVRVTLASATRRVDLVLPGAVPVAELLPELARAVGLLTARSAHLGHRLRTATGRPLAGDAGLLAQGVVDGALLTLLEGVADPLPRRHDDLAEAVRDVVEHDLAHHPGPLAGSTAPVAAVLALVLGALALLVQEDPLGAAAAAAGAAAGLLGGAALLSRLRPDPGPGLAALGAAAAYAVVAGVLLAGRADLPPLLGGSAGAAAAGLTGLLALGAGRAWAIPVVLAGLGGLVAVVGDRLLDAPPALVAAALLVLVTLGAVLLPRLALGLVPGVDRAGERGHDQPVDLVRLSHDVRAAHEVLLALVVSVGLGVLVLVPFAVALGAAGTTLAVAACLVVLLRARRHRVAAEVVAATVLGVAALLSTAGAVLVLHPGWRPGTAAVLLASGVGVLVAGAVPGAGSVRRGRLGDLAETAAVLSLLPVLAVAVGLADRLGV